MSAAIAPRSAQSKRPRGGACRTNRNLRGRRGERRSLPRLVVVDLEHVLRDRRGGVAAVAAVLDEDGEGDLRVAVRREPDEPRVIALLGRELQLVLDADGG